MGSAVLNIVAQKSIEGIEHMQGDAMLLAKAPNVFRWDNLVLPAMKYFEVVSVGFEFSALITRQVKGRCYQKQALGPDDLRSNRCHISPHTGADQNNVLISRQLHCQQLFNA